MLVKQMVCAARQQGLGLDVGFEVAERVKLAVCGTAKRSRRVGNAGLLQRDNDRDRVGTLVERVMVYFGVICLLSFLSWASGLGNSL